MAIKITGTTVINDSRELENITDIGQIVRAPEVLSPTDNETDVDFNGPTIEGSGYNALFGGREYREFQVDLATGDFSSPVVSEQVNSDSLTLTTELADDTEHKVRIRDIDIDGTVGPFSNVVNFTTAINPFTQGFGTATNGGFYMGTIAASGTCYYLIVAPNSTGCACCQWKTTYTETLGVCSEDDGFANTYTGLNNGSHPAGNFTATRTIDGFTDWYLPAIDEGQEISSNINNLPSGEGYTDNQFYWISMQESTSSGCVLKFSDNRPDTELTCDFYPARAIRRVPI